VETMSTRKNVLLTTSREPTDKIRTFCNDIAYAIPNVIRVNRGKLSLDRVAEKALELNADRIIIVDRWKDGFATIRFFRTGTLGLIPFPPLLYVTSVRVRREFEAKTKRIKSIAVTVPSENSPATKRLAQAISDFFDTPASVSQKAVSNFSAAMHISGITSERFRITFLLPMLIEVGPRIDISKVVWDESE